MRIDNNSTMIVFGALLTLGGAVAIWFTRSNRVRKTPRAEYEEHRMWRRSFRLLFGYAAIVTGLLCLAYAGIVIYEPKLLTGVTGWLIMAVFLAGLGFTVWCFRTSSRLDQKALAITHHVQAVLRSLDFRTPSDDTQP